MKNSEGQFVAEGIVFTVEEGMVVGVTAPDEVLQAVSETSQRTLIGIILTGGKIPFAELGLGFYAIAGVDTYEDSSVLSREKGGPHGGMGVDPSDSSPESKLMKELAGDFHHTDFVMDDPRITHYDKQGQPTQFYPPQV